MILYGLEKCDNTLFDDVETLAMSLRFSYHKIPETQGKYEINYSDWTITLSNGEIFKIKRYIYEKEVTHI